MTAGNVNNLQCNDYDRQTILPFFVISLNFILLLSSAHPLELNHAVVLYPPPDLLI